MKAIWPDNPFRAQRTGITSEEYGQQIGKSKGQARKLLEAMVEAGRAERVITRANTVNRTKVVRYVIKEHSDAMAGTGAD